MKPVLSRKSDSELRVDIDANRRAEKWTRSELVRRAIWELLGQNLFAISPRPMWAWRCGLLRAFGAKIGRNVHLHPTVRIAIPWNLNIGDFAAVGDGAILYSLGVITIGRGATVSQYAHLCAGSHEFRRADMALTRPPIVIGEGVWICADAFVGPSVTISPMAVVGARAVVVRDVPGEAIVAGNPSQVIGRR